MPNATFKMNGTTAMSKSGTDISIASGVTVPAAGVTGTLGSGVTLGSAVTGSPALTAPALGTPVSGILTNCTGIQLPYMKLSGGSCSISTSWNVVNWTVLDSSSLATYSSGVLVENDMFMILEVFSILLIT